MIVIGLLVFAVMAIWGVASLGGAIGTAQGALEDTLDAVTAANTKGSSDGNVVLILFIVLTIAALWFFSSPRV